MAINPILTEKTNDSIAVTESYSIERPANVASGKIFDKIIEASTRYGIHTDTALRIAYCESRINQYNAEGNVLHGKQNPADAGIFQINEKWHLKQSQELGFDIYTTDGNIEYAMWLMKKEGNKHWKWSKPCWGEDGKVKNA